jgi:hypothetical protein
MDNKYNELIKYSNPELVKKNIIKYFGKPIPLAISTRWDKKYMLQDPNGRWVHFGGFNPPMMDFTKHRDPERRRLYLQRSTNIKGDWKSNKYSPNQLSISLLWD